MRMFLFALLTAVMICAGSLDNIAAADDWGPPQNEVDLFNYKVPINPSTKMGIPGPPGTVPTNTDIRRDSLGEPFRGIRSPLHVTPEYGDWRRIDYRSRIESQLFDLSKQIRDIVEQVKTGKRRVPADLRARIESLKDREAIVREKLMQLRTATSREEWFRARAELDRVFNDLKVGLDTSRFRLMGFAE